MAGGVARESPAQLNGHPPRRFYSGRNLARAVSIDDLRARILHHCHRLFAFFSVTKRAELHNKSGFFNDGQFRGGH